MDCLEKASQDAKSRRELPMENFIVATLKMLLDDFASATKKRAPSDHHPSLKGTTRDVFLFIIFITVVSYL
jgi:hypothetical protein